MTTYDGLFHGFFSHVRPDRRRQGRVRRRDRRGRRRGRPERSCMAVIDLAGFVADLKDHAVEHGFHVHDERHFVESYSLRQNWEVDLHPEEGCDGPGRPLPLARDRPAGAARLRGRGDRAATASRTRPTSSTCRSRFTWALPPLPHAPDLLVLATDLAAIGGPDLPLEVSAIDSYPSVTDAPETSAAGRRPPAGVAAAHPRRRGGPVRDPRPLPRW